MTPTRAWAKSSATIIITSVRQFSTFGQRSLPRTRIFKVRLRGSCPSTVAVTVVAGAIAARDADAVTMAVVAGSAVAIAGVAPCAVSVAAGLPAAVLLWAAAVSLPPIQLVQSSRRMRPTSSAVGVWKADNKWCNRFTGTQLARVTALWCVIDGCLHRVQPPGTHRRWFDTGCLRMMMP